MKQLFTLLTVLAVSFLNAQVFSENFDGGVPGNLIEDTVNGNHSWGPCGSDTGGVPCPINGSGSATFYHASQTAYNTALMTPVMDLSSGVYKATFTLAKKMKNERVNEFHVEISTDGGNTWTTMSSYMDEIAQPTEFTVILTPYAPTAETSVRFRARNRGGHRLILDDVAISQVTADDAAIESLNLLPLFAAGPTEIGGVMRNYGLNPITSFDLNWQVGDGEVHTQTYTAQNIASGQEFNFVHADLWDAVGGDHEVKVWVSNTNVTDADSSNDMLTQTVTVASGTAYKVPMFEKFSSSTCPPCYTFNTLYFTPFWNNYGHDKATFISYQVNWPGAGDPYYTAEVGARVSYYGINAAPSILLNAADLGNMPNTTMLQNYLDNEINTDRVSYFKIDSDHSLDGSVLTVDVDITPYISGNYTVRVMVIEKLTTGNVASNGETSFKHVFMKALPNASGTNVAFQFDQVETLSLSTDLSSTNVEELSDIAVVVFIQDNATKEIMQSGYTTSSNIVLGIDDQVTKSDIIMVPNPTKGLVKIISQDEVQVQVFDLSGRNVFAQSKVSANSTLNLSGLGKGVFVVHMTQKDGSKIVKKLIIN